MWVTCALGPYNFEFMTEVKQEIMSRYRVDGIFINRWDGSGMCYCEHCRTNFRAATGHDLPRTNDPQDPARRAYILWRQQRLFELWRLWDAEVRKINPDSCVIPNTGGGATSSLDMKTHRRARADALRRPPGAPRPDAALGQRQEREGVPRDDGRASRSSGIFSVGVEEPYRWKDSVQSAAEIRLWVADGVANGLRPWFTKFSGALHDRALAEAGRGPLPLAPRRPSATCATSGRSRASAWSTRSRPRGSTAASARATGSRTTRSAGIRR